MVVLNRHLFSRIQVFFKVALKRLNTPHHYNSMEHQRFNIKGKKVWIIAGEESGDLYGAELAHELKTFAPGLILQGMGGREMKAAGIDILVDSTELGVVGLTEVLRNIMAFLRIFRYLVQEAKKEQPDAIVLIDYPGFNLRYAKKIHKSGTKLIYYISPQVWAWKANRIPILASTITKMLVIFPFEKDIYHDVGLNTVFVGHPLVDIMKKEIRPGIKREDHLVLLLPGSRFNEIEKLLIPMIETALKLYNKDNRFRFIVAAPRKKIYEQINNILTRLTKPLPSSIPIQIVTGETELWMQKATAGIAASGTVTIQSAIFALPLVVVYKVNAITYLIGRKLVKVQYIAMVNLIFNGVVYEEFLQDKVNPAFLLPALERILPGGERRKNVLRDLHSVRNQLKGKGNASRNAAIEILNEIMPGLKE